MHCIAPDSGSVPTLNNKSHNLFADGEVDRHANLLPHEASPPVVHVVLPPTVVYLDLRLNLPAVVHHSSRDQKSVQLYPSLKSGCILLCATFTTQLATYHTQFQLVLGLITVGGVPMSQVPRKPQYGVRL